MERVNYREIPANIGAWGWAIALAVLIAIGGLAVLQMEHQGHIITGMNNQIVWGLPHVFAIFLIVAASGALNVASMASVFDNKAYKPLARLSGVTAIALLVGGLITLVLDLGRPDRLLVAMTYYNFKSIFAWNIILYTGFMAIVGVYLWVQMDRNVHPKWQKPMGRLAFVWRLILTMGTGSIFGFLVARQGYGSAIYAPLFIAMSFAFGLAVFNLVLFVLARISGRKVDASHYERLGKLLGWFLALVIFMLVILHISNLYWARNFDFSMFILVHGGIYTQLFWCGFVGAGAIIPMALVWGWNFDGKTMRFVLASILTVLGGLVLVYVIVIGGQAYPLVIFPGYEFSSSFFEGEVSPYTPSVYEWALGIGGFALALLATGIGAKVLRILPTQLAVAAEK